MARNARRRTFSLSVGLAAAALALAVGGPVRAQLTLTAAGVAQGLSLSTFATGFPSDGGVGPLGIAFPTTGGVLVSDYPGNVRLFPTDTDGQNAGSVPVAQNYGGHNADGFASALGNIYMTRQGIGDVVQINNNGTLNQGIVTGVPAATGLATDPLNGHLFASTLGNNIIYDIDPVAKTKSVFLNQSADGLSVSPDGTTLYAAINGHIYGYNIASKAQVFDSGAVPGGVDGTAAGAGPLFSNFVFANTNSGQVYEVNLTTSAQTLIATGGSRGDFVTVDPTNNTLLLTQTDRIIRLSGASFVVPEPSPLVLAGVLGVLACAARLTARRFRKRGSDAA
jgi:sugar lactone lactonase YvrE